MLGLLIDIALLAVFGLCVYRGWKNGLVRGVCGFLALVLSIVFANVAAKSLSGDVYGMLRPFVGGIVDGKLQDVLSAGHTAGFDTAPDEHEKPRTYFVSKETLQSLGIFEPAARSLSDAIAAETREVGYALGDVISDKLSSTLAYIFVFAVSFVLLAIVFAVAGSLISMVFSLPGLKLVDSVLGIAFGALRGLVIVFFITSLFRYLGIVSGDLVVGTGISEYLGHNNPVANVLGI